MSAVHTLETLDTLQRDPQQRVLDVAARLESAPVGVNVNVAHGSLDADAAARRAPGVGVQDVHKLGIVSGQSVLDVCVFKVGTCWIQTYGEGEKGMNRKEFDRHNINNKPVQEEV